MADKKTELELAYFAGFFDGEGMMGIYEKSSTYVCVFANTDIRPLSRAHELWGGSLSCQIRAGTRGAIQDMWRLQINGHEAAAFLIDVRPYLRLKSEQADVFLEVVKYIPGKPGMRRIEGATESLQAADRQLRLMKRGAA